jgi:uncharacterized protein YggE
MKTLVTTSLLGLLMISTAYGDEVKHSERRILPITGYGQVSVAPDKASFTVGVRTITKKASDAVSKNNADMAKVISNLKKVVESKDIQTNNFSLSPNYVYDQSIKQNRTEGYIADNNVTVTIRQMDKIGEVIDAAVQDGSTTITNLNFGNSDPDPIRDKAREKSVENAKHLAELYAKAADVTLGDILSIEEGGAGGSPYSNFAKTASASMEAAGASPIEAGQNKYIVSTTITWEIK